MNKEHFLMLAAVLSVGYVLVGTLASLTGKHEAVQHSLTHLYRLTLLALLAALAVA